MEYLIFVSVIFGLLANALGKSVNSNQEEVASRHCQTFVEYYNPRTKSCEPCTQCPKGSTVLQPCMGSLDTICESYEDFLREVVRGLDAADKRTEAPITTPTRSSLPGVGRRVPVEVLPDSHWYTLSMVLLVILCLICVGIFACIGYYFFFCDKKKSQNKEIIYRSDPEFLQRYPVSEEPRYVEVLSSRERLLSHPWSSYRMNAHESLTLSGLAPISPIQMPKTNIYVNMLDYTTRDDDYVYIDEE